MDTNNIKHHLSMIQIAKIFSEYLNCEIIHKGEDGEFSDDKKGYNDYNEKGILHSINLRGELHLLVEGIKRKESFYGLIGDDVKLLLVPIEKISDEIAIKAATIMCPQLDWRGYAENVKVERLNNNDICVSSKQLMVRVNKNPYAKSDYPINNCNMPISSYKEINYWGYLKSQNVSIPLFIEYGHPDNGKTAIELGLAIEK